MGPSSPVSAGGLGGGRSASHQSPYTRRCVVFKSKPEIALDQIKAALAGGFAPRVALADTGYGVDGAFGSGVTGMGLADAMGVQSTLSVWPPDKGPLPPKPWSGRGRKPSHVRRAADYRPV